MALDASWDEEMLRVEIESLREMEFDPMLAGFDEKELEALFAGDGGDAKDDDFDLSAALEKASFVEPGDIWTVGRHRLMCGDATKAEDVETLMGGERANLIVTDPPYGVSFKSSSGLTIQNDSIKNEEFYAFLLSAFKNMADVLEKGGAAYVFHADTEGLNFRRAFIDAGFHLAGCCIWVKDSLVLGRSDYQWQHEPILYGWKAGGKHRWFGGRKQGTTINDNFPVVMSQDADGSMLINFASGNKNLVLRVPAAEVVNTEDASTLIYVDKPKRNGEHPTMKPIALCARCIKNSSQRDDTVLDLFGGSGSTLIACEQLHRSCYMMELDPVYCDVIIQRYIEFSGNNDVFVEKPDGTLEQWSVD
jgi:DNA modification methylase